VLIEIPCSIHCELAGAYEERVYSLAGTRLSQISCQYG
jgi:hypothetical protein